MSIVMSVKSLIGMKFFEHVRDWSLLLEITLALNIPGSLVGNASPGFRQRQPIQPPAGGVPGNHCRTGSALTGTCVTNECIRRGIRLRRMFNPRIFGLTSKHYDHTTPSNQSHHTHRSRPRRAALAQPARGIIAIAFTSCTSRADRPVQIASPAVCV